MSPIPVTRPRGRLALAVPVLIAVPVGLGTGLAPYPTLLGAAAVVSVLVLLPRLEWAALVVVATAVFESYLDLLDPWATEWLTVVLLLAWAVRRARGPLHAQRTVTVLAPAAVFAVVVLLATVAHPNGTAGLAVVTRYALVLAVLVVLVDCLSGPLDPRRAARVYVLSCVAASLCGLVTAVVAESHRVAGPLASPDDLAFFLVAALPLAGTVAGRSRPSWPSVVCAGVLFAGVIGTQSRGAWVALVVVSVLAVATGVLALRHVGVLLVVVATGIALVVAVRPHPVDATFTLQQRYAETRISQRADLWEAAAAMTRAHPGLGLGPGSFALFHRDYRDEATDLAGRDLDVAHSTPLQASAELGILGAATLLAIFVVPVVAARRRWRRDRSRVTASAGLALIGLIVAAAFETEQYHLPLWFLAALTTALGQRRRPRVLVLDERGLGRPGRPDPGPQVSLDPP